MQIANDDVGDDCGYGNDANDVNGKGDNDDGEGSGQNDGDGSGRGGGGTRLAATQMKVNYYYEEVNHKT